MAQQKVLVSGASGLVGTAFCDALRRDGHEVLKLVRRAPSKPDELRWKPDGTVDIPYDLPLDTVVHLAGEQIMGLWTAAKRKRIRDSRVNGTSGLAKSLASLSTKPKAMICASAVGYYGSRGDEVLTESSAPGSGFLAETCIAWEAAAQPARDAGIPVVNVRIGIVMSDKGGAFKSMLAPFRLGLGSRLGSGHQWVSWIALNDLVNVFRFAIANEGLTGPINGVAPNPVTNAELTKLLANALHRPTFLPIPEFALKLVPGNMAEEAFLSSERVIPERLQQLGFQFEFPELKSAFEAMLK